MSTNLSGENLKLLIFLVLLPIFVFSVSTASKVIYTVEEYTPPVYAESNLKRLKILNSAVPPETIATLKVEIADSPEERSRGLSGRKSLPANRGMIFVFPELDQYSFWMKEMNFGLDFVWISGNKIIDVVQNVRPDDYEPPKVLVSKEKADKVLELNAGAAARLGIKAGDRIEIN